MAGVDSMQWNKEIHLDLELQVADFTIPTVRSPRIFGGCTKQHAKFLIPHQRHMCCRNTKEEQCAKVASGKVHGERKAWKTDKGNTNSAYFVCSIAISAN